MERPSLQESLPVHQPSQVDKQSDISTEEPARIFKINPAEPPQPPFASNSIKTSKYSVVTFLPKFLLEQFSKMANLYFLVMCFLQMIPVVTITNGTPTVLPPLFFVLFVSAVKDLIEDYGRHKADEAENLSHTLVLNCETRRFEQRRWKEITVGQLVKV